MRSILIAAMTTFTFAVPTSVSPSSMTTCSTDTHCRLFDEKTATCDTTTYKCKSSTAAVDKCTYFSGSNNIYPQCSSTGGSVTAEIVSLYYTLSNNNADCTKVNMFTAPYDVIIKRAMGETTMAATTAAITHLCYDNIVRTAVRSSVRIADILSASDVVVNVGKLINDLLQSEPSTSIVKNVGTVDYNQMGSRESFENLCEKSIGVKTAIPFSETPASGVVGNRGCAAIECLPGYVLQSNIVNTQCLPLTGTYEIRIALDITGEMVDIASITEILSNTISLALGTNTTSCANICSVNGCLTCADARLLSRSDIVLADIKHTLTFIDVTTKSLDRARNDVNISLTNFFSTEGSVPTGLKIVFNGNVVVYVPLTSEDDLPDGAIAGIVVGCLAFVVLSVTIVYFFCYNTGAVADTIDEAEKTNPDQQ